MANMQPSACTGEPDEPRLPKICASTGFSASPEQNDDTGRTGCVKMHPRRCTRYSGPPTALLSSSSTKFKQIQTDTKTTMREPILPWPDDIDGRQANNLQQSWRFDWEPPKAVLRDVWTIIWIVGC